MMPKPFLTPSAGLRTLTVACMLTGCATLHAQAPAAPADAVNQKSPLPAYDAVSVKPNKDERNSWRISSRDTIFSATNISVKNLLSNAYGIRPGLIFGLPGWAESAHFDINAKITDPDLAALKEASSDQRRAMLATVLAERFGVKVHTESRVMPVYDLVLAQDGPKFKESPVPVENTAPASGPKPQARGNVDIHNGAMTATAVPMATLCAALVGETDRSVIDRTGLTGNYDLHLEWTPEARAGKTNDNGLAEAPMIFTALQEQLGLKLVPAKAPVDTLVVDHVEMPAVD